MSRHEGRLLIHYSVNSEQRLTFPEAEAKSIPDSMTSGNRNTLKK